VYECAISQGICAIAGSTRLNELVGVSPKAPKSRPIIIVLLLALPAPLNPAQQQAVAALAEDLAVAEGIKVLADDRLAIRPDRLRRIAAKLRAKAKSAQAAKEFYIF
jgi:hypothetical protein